MLPPVYKQSRMRHPGATVSRDLDHSLQWFLQALREGGLEKTFV